MESKNQALVIAAQDHSSMVTGCFLTSITTEYIFVAGEDLHGKKDRSEEDFVFAQCDLL